MARTVLWNRVLLDEFIDLASLSEDEERVIRARAAGWSRVKMCHEYNMPLAAKEHAPPIKAGRVFWFG